MLILLVLLLSHLEALRPRYCHFFYSYLFDDDVAPEGGGPRAHDRTVVC
jgi:hypothetical protein